MQKTNRVRLANDVQDLVSIERRSSDRVSGRNKYCPLVVGATGPGNTGSFLLCFRRTNEETVTFLGPFSFRQKLLSNAVIGQKSPGT